MPKSLIPAMVAAMLAFPAAFQAYAEDDRQLRRDVEFLSDDLCGGRASGSEGSEMARLYIADRFRDIGLNPIGWHFTQSFKAEDSTILRNIAGIIHSSGESDEYVIICAHYDHIGTIGGTIYNGADDNASRVAALLMIASRLMEMKNAGTGPGCNLIFVALDGKELNMAGSRHFVEEMTIPPHKIRCAINIDIIGSDLVPVGKRKDYIIALGENTLPPSSRGYISHICSTGPYRMDLDLSFYGSRDFTKMMYISGDHHSFAAKKIPAVFFTSGFHSLTYKAGDDACIVNFDLLRRRAMVICRFISCIGNR